MVSVELCDRSEEQLLLHVFYLLLNTVCALLVILTA